MISPSDRPGPDGAHPIQTGEGRPAGFGHWNARRERRPVAHPCLVENPFPPGANARKNGIGIFVDPEARYRTAASITPPEIIPDEIMAACQG